MTKQILILFLLFACASTAQAEPKLEENFFNGKDLNGWKGEMEFWSVKDGVIVGNSDKNLSNNKFLWSDIEVGDFYLSLDVRMPKDDRNAGIQFRSQPTDTSNLQAVGYQADAGKNVWGRLYHEHGRCKLDWRDRGEKAVKPGEWNRYEIMAVGNRIWTAINGQMAVSINDLAGGEKRGFIALQIHSGQAQTVEYKINKLVHNPKVELEGMSEAELIQEADAKTIERQPNFVIIYTDDQGYGDLSCFGSETVKTPHIDRMAKEGRKFTNFTMPTSLCTPSRASLLTGSYAKRVGMHEWVLLPHSDKGLNPAEHTIADQLKSQGYKTAMFGKWHLGHHKETLPHRNGFDTWFGIPYSNDMNHPDNQGKPDLSLAGLDELWRDQMSTLTKWKTPLMENDSIVELPVDQRTITRRYTDKAIDFIKERGKKNKPFFVYLPHTMPHLPLYVPEEYFDADPKKAYIKTMEHIDAEVGRLLDYLRESGLDKNTYVIFTSDNGPAAGNKHHAGSSGGLRGQKVTTFEGGLRVPCVMWAPGKIPAGTTCDELMTTLDVLPTIASLTKSKLPGNRKIDGIDASALLTDANAKSPRKDMLIYDGHGRLEGIRQEPWKLLIKKNGNTMLFNLDDDVNEQTNLVDANANRVAQLTDRMNELGAEVDANTRAPWKKNQTLPQAPAEISFDKSELLSHTSAKLVPSKVGGQAIRSRVEFSPTVNWQTDKKPFTISAWVKPDGLRQAGILCCGGYGWLHGWLLDMQGDGSLRFETSNRNNQNNGSVKTKRGLLKPGKWTHVAVAVHSNKWADLFVDGEIVAKNRLNGIDLANPKAKLVIGGIENSTNHNFPGVIDQVKMVAGNAQSPGEVGEYYHPVRSKLGNEASGNEGGPEAIKRFSSSQSRGIANPFSNGEFTVEPNEMIVFMGQTDMVRSRLDGTLESTIASHFAKQKPRLRNMAWESDTVYEQWRDIDFGSWEDQLNAVGATTVIAQFGQIEAMQGAKRLPEFIAAYEKLLDQIAKRTRRLVLISPRPFEKPVSDLMPDHSGKNDVVAQYRDAIKQLAESRNAVFVDLFDRPYPVGSPTQRGRVTTNGIHLTDKNQSIVAIQIASALALPTTKVANHLRSTIIEKNRLWYDNWRPMNWSFAFGDRTQQMFSKASGDRPPLKVEIEEFKPLLQKADEDIHLAALGNPVEMTPAPVMQPASAPPGDHSVEAQMASFKVLDGFEINLFASEADGIVKPVQMRWDDRGRLWVICTPTYPHVEPGLRPGDYIVVCEDTDGDGKADKFDRFAEGLFIPMGLEFGDGGLYITEATELVHIKDTDNDGKADQRTVILSGFGTADSHQMINGLERGPLGDFWFTQGHHAYSRVETPWGVSQLDKSGVWRYRPATGKLDGFFNKSMSGLNCQGVTHDDWGQTFHNSAAGSGGFYTSPGAIATLRTRGLKCLTPNPSRNTGIEFIGSSHLPDELQGQIVWGAFMSNSIELRQLSDDGSGFIAKKMPDLVQSSRQEFRPVNTRVGPDGAIYVADWYNLTIGHYQASYADPMRDRTHGRIWRITAKDRPLLETPDFDSLDINGLIALLSSKDRLTRTNAKKRLFDLPSDKVIPVVDQKLATAQDAALIYQLAGVLAAHEEVRPELIDTMINAEEPRLRAIGARLIGRWSDRIDNPLELLEKTAADENPRVRMESIVAATHITSPQSIKVVTKTLDFPQDRFIEHAFFLAVHALRDQWLDGLESGELNFDENPDHLSTLLNIDPKGTLDLVRQLAQSKQPEHLALLVRVGQPKDLNFAFKHGSRSPEVLKSLLEAARIHRKNPSGETIPTLTAILETKNPGTLSYAISLAGAWKARSATDFVVAQLSGVDTSEAVRLAAIENLIKINDTPKHRELIERFASADQPAAVQNAAIKTIAAVDASQAACLVLKLLPTISEAKEMTPLVAILLQGPGRGDQLAALLGKEPLDKAVTDRLQQALGLTGQTSKSLAAAINKAHGNTGKIPEYDARFVKALKREVQTKGDFERGKTAYTKAGTCIGCHKINGVGGMIGPNLSEVGAGRSLELLIESVLWPNRQIREGYMTTRITTKGNQLYVGYKTADKDGAITLRDIATTNQRKIAKADVIKEEEAGSAMVAGLTSALSRQELADLIAYMAGLKKK